MITINLRPGARRQTKSGPAFAGLGARIVVITSKVKEPWLAAALTAWVGVVIFLGAVYISTATKLSTLEPQLDAARTEYSRYTDFVKQKRREENVRDSILAQIGTITSVDQERYTWPHILDDIGSALPDFTWLTEVSMLAPAGAGANNAAAAVETGVVAPVNLRIIGRTSDLQNYTAFLRRLEESPWLTNVLPVEAKTVVEGNRALTSFIIQASYTRADPAHIRTVPVIESVVR
ncbi:MAG: PilN domain-containing protein [Gemmatimonadota bacterium]